MPKAGLDVCEDIMELARSRGRQIGHKATHAQLDLYIDAVAGIDARTHEKYKRSLVAFRYLKNPDEFGRFEILRFSRAKKAAAAAGMEKSMKEAGRDGIHWDN